MSRTWYSLLHTSVSLPQPPLTTDTNLLSHPMPLTPTLISSYQQPRPMSLHFLTPSPLPHSFPHKKPHKNIIVCLHNSKTQTLEKNPKLFRPDYPDPFPRKPISNNHNISEIIDEEEEDDLWLTMKHEAQSDVNQEPILSNYYFSAILSHNIIESALAGHLSGKLGDSSLPSATLYDLIMDVLTEDQEIVTDVKYDLKAVKERDPACISYVQCFLNFKGFLACQAHRIAHNLWSRNRRVIALIIQNRVSEVFALDIHPGAKIGRGVMLDHATGLVIGETAVIGNNVSILHNVTLGGTGKMSGDRHPKIGDGVLIGAGTCVLGNVRIGEGAKIGAGSVVLRDVPPRTTAVGNPAKLIGGKENPIRLDKIPGLTMDHTLHINEWSDYVI